MAELIQIPKPDLGRPNDSRLTQDYIDSRPELAGVRPFVQGEDVDLVDELNDRLGTLHAQMTYDTNAVQREADAAAVREPVPVINEAALAGKPAGQYTLTSSSEGVAWNGEAVTARGAALGTAADTLRANLLATLATKYTSASTINPATPSQAERDAYAAAHPERPWMPGSRRTAEGGVQALRDGAAGWVAEGQPSATAGALAVQAAKLGGVQAITTPAQFVGVPEEPVRGAKQTLPQRVEARLYGLGMNAAVQSISNLPGSRTLVNAVNTLAELGPYGFDFVGQIVNFDVNSELYSVPIGATTFTANTFTVSGLAGFDAALLQEGVFVRTTHPEQWYAPITAVNVSTGVVTVSEWRRRSNGTTGTPANGTGAAVLLNPIDKAFLRNGVLGFTADSPTRVGVYDEADIYIAGGDAAARGYDVTVLGDGSNSTDAAVKVRSAPGAGAMRYGFAALGAVWDVAFYSGPNPNNPSATRPQWDAVLTYGTTGGILSQGDRTHLLCRSANDTELLRVAGDGALFLKGRPFGPAVRVTRTANAAAGDFASKAEFNALLDELRDLENKIINSGVML